MPLHDQDGRNDGLMIVLLLLGTPFGAVGAVVGLLALIG